MHITAYMYKTPDHVLYVQYVSMAIMPLLGSANPYSIHGIGLFSFHRGSLLHTLSILGEFIVSRYIHSRLNNN